MIKKYLDEANILNAVLCITVVFIHASSEAVSLYNKDSFLYAIMFALWKLASYVVPGYFFLSGFRFFYASTGKSFHYCRYIIGRLLKIYVPYLIWVFIYYLYFIRRGYFSFDIKALLQYVLYGNLVAHFYFIVTIMQFYLLMPLWITMTRVIKPGYSLLIALAITIFCRVYLTSFLQWLFKDTNIILVYNDRILTSYMVFWVAGCYAGAHYERFSAFLDQYKTLIVIAFLAVTGFHLPFSYLSSRSLFFYKYAEIVHILFCFICAIFVYSFSRLCYKLLRGIPLILKIFLVLNQITFYVYLSHIYVINRITILLDEKSVISISKRFLIRAVCTYVIAFAGSYLYVWCKKTFKENQHANKNTR